MVQYQTKMEAVVIAKWLMSATSQSTLFSAVAATVFGLLSSCTLILYFLTQGTTLPPRGYLLLLLSFGAISAVPLFLLLRFSFISPLVVYAVMLYAFVNVNKIRGPGEPLVPLVLFSFVPLIAMLLLAIAEFFVRSSF